MPRRQSRRGPSTADVAGPIVPGTPLYRFVQMVAARMVERRTDRAPRRGRAASVDSRPPTDAPSAAPGGDDAGGADSG
jgi:hypothetical protein